MNPNRVAGYRSEYPIQDTFFFDQIQCVIAFYLGGGPETVDTGDHKQDADNAPWDRKIIFRVWHNP